MDTMRSITFWDDWKGNRFLALGSKPDLEDFSSDFLIFTCDDSVLFFD
jgi:hypothetical protein